MAMSGLQLQCSSQAVAELRGSGLMITGKCASARRPAAGTFSVRANLQQGAGNDSAQNLSRRVALGLVAAGVAFVPLVSAAEAKPNKKEEILPGEAVKSEEPKDFDLPLDQVYYFQELPADQAAVRAKESAKDIYNVKQLIDKKAWDYVHNDLRLKAEYLRFDLRTIISAKPNAEKKSLIDLSGKLFDTITKLDYAAKKESTSEAEKYYAETVSALDDVLSKIG